MVLLGTLQQPSWPGRLHCKKELEDYVHVVGAGGKLLYLRISHRNAALQFGLKTFLLPSVGRKKILNKSSGSLGASEAEGELLKLFGTGALPNASWEHKGLNHIETKGGWAGETSVLLKDSLGSDPSQGVEEKMAWRLCSDKLRVHSRWV